MTISPLAKRHLPTGRAGTAHASTSQSENEFEALYRDHASALYRLAWASCGDPQLAEDVVQNAFADAHRRWPELSALDRPDLWVRRAVLNRSANVRRDRARDDERYQRLGQRTGASVGIVDVDPTTSELLDLIMGLPDLQRRVVLLHYFDDQSVKAIAEILEVHPGTVKTSLSRARTALAKQLSPAQGSSTTSADGTSSSVFAGDLHAQEDQK